MQLFQKTLALNTLAWHFILSLKAAQINYFAFEMIEKYAIINHHGLELFCSKKRDIFENSK